MQQSIALVLSCGTCQRRVSLVIDHNPRTAPFGEATWICPACQTVHRTGVVGHVLSIQLETAPAQTPGSQPD